MLSQIILLKTQRLILFLVAIQLVFWSLFGIVFSHYQSSQEIDSISIKMSKLRLPKQTPPLPDNLVTISAHQRLDNAIWSITTTTNTYFINSNGRLVKKLTAKQLTAIVQSNNPRVKITSVKLRKNKRAFVIKLVKNKQPYKVTLHPYTAEVVNIQATATSALQQPWLWYRSIWRAKFNDHLLFLATISLLSAVFALLLFFFTKKK